ncbi:cyclic peptide export ABC transporter [Scytonema sp. PCC 10023]|uniref:cyclic peptide export ABC transporter n=1 Tax=Scytonema sp. PCC 10023 TaxID=1680591 RepID=UPI0039C665F2
MNLIWFLLRTSFVAVVSAALTGAVSGICSAFLIATINNTVNSTPSYTSQSFWSFIWLTFVTFLASLFSQFLLVGLSQEAIYKLRLRLSGWILACPLRQLEELGANRLLATLTDDIQSISNAVFDIPFLCINIALFAGCLAYLLRLSWGVFLITLMFVAVVIASVQLLISKAQGVWKLAREEQDQLFKHFHAITDGIKELKLHRARQEAFLTEDLQATAASSRDYKITSLRILAIANSLGELLFFTTLGLLVFALPKLTPTNSSVLSGYILTITYLIRPLQSILQILPALSQASVALQKIDTLGLSLASRSETIPIEQPQRQYFFNSIELIKITHIYCREAEDSHFTLGPIDVTFQPGELVFIVGGNGSGKSTLAKLIAGLYIPETGEIRWDGKPITSQNREMYRQLFSAVFSDFYLFERILGINLTDLDAKAQEYLSQLQLSHKVVVNKGVLSTTDLSQGQRKRLALLTAYLEDRPIYLFDEWASEQDPFFREVFYKQLLQELKNRVRVCFDFIYR